MVRAVKGSAQCKGRLVGFQNGSIPQRGPRGARARVEGVGTRNRPTASGGPAADEKRHLLYAQSPGRGAGNRCGVSGGLTDEKSSFPGTDGRWIGSEKVDGLRSSASYRTPPVHRVSNGCGIFADLFRKIVRHRGVTDVQSVSEFGHELLA